MSGVLGAGACSEDLRESASVGDDVAALRADAGAFGVCHEKESTDSISSILDVVSSATRRGTSTRLQCTS